ncbi:hypothetical protein YC2023_075114 [Brassica napus]
MRLTGCWLRNRKMGLESCLRSLWAVFRLEAFITASFDKERTFRGFYVLVETLGLIRHLKSLLYSRIREAWLAWFRPEVCLARGVLKRLLFQRFFIISPLFGEVFALSGLSPVSWFRTDAPGSWEILWLVLSRGCAWGAFFLGVVTRGWRFLWQRVSSYQTASASLSVYLSLGFGFLTVATRSSLSSPIIIVILWR